MNSLFSYLAQPFLHLGVLITRHRQLTLEMAKRELSERFSGEFFGTFWVIAHPLFLIALYVFVFSFVFKMKSGGNFSEDGNYTIYLLSGLIPWMAFQESLVKSCHAIIGNSSLVKQVVFPIEVLPLKTLVTALTNQAVASTLLFIYIFYTGAQNYFSLYALPFLWIVQIFMMLGLSYALSAVSVFVRDTKDVVQIFSVAGLYLVPVFYLPTMLPAAFQPALTLNPFSHIIWCYQDAIFFGRVEHPWSWLIFVTTAFFSFILGFRVFRSLKPMFGNAL